jgi:hypothetical protein
MGSQWLTCENICYKDDPWVLADSITQAKQKNVGVENVEDNDEDVNQFEEMPLFTNPINIKHIEKDFDKNLILYM